MPAAGICWNLQSWHDERKRKHIMSKSYWLIMGVAWTYLAYTVVLGLLGAFGHPYIVNVFGH
jgi:hypothetical protein